MNYPPILMKKSTAALYVDMSVAAFEREVIAGRMPQPILIGGKDHWDRRAIENALDALSGRVKDWRERSPLYESLQT